jgi:hypothetical protein
MFSASRRRVAAIPNVKVPSKRAKKAVQARWKKKKKKA